MNTTTAIALTRDITAWAKSEDLPPQDLFPSIDEYRQFVHAWKAVYREASARLRAQGVKFRYDQSKRDVETAKRYGIQAVTAAWRETAHNEATVVLSLPRSELYTVVGSSRHPAPKYDTRYWKPEQITEMSKVYSDVWSSDATWLLEQRAAGKRWVKAHHPWKLRVTPGAGQ